MIVRAAGDTVNMQVLLSQEEAWARLAFPEEPNSRPSSSGQKTLAARRAPPPLPTVPELHPKPTALAGTTDQLQQYVHSWQQHLSDFWQGQQIAHRPPPAPPSAHAHRPPPVWRRPQVFSSTLEVYKQQRVTMPHGITEIAEPLVSRNIAIKVHPLAKGKGKVKGGKKKK